jgi:ferric-dicitrate binding protein FerR (iron transport regulator)
MPPSPACAPAAAGPAERVLPAVAPPRRPGHGTLAAALVLLAAALATLLFLALVVAPSADAVGGCGGG